MARAQSTETARTFKALSDILGRVQQQIGQSHALALWRASPFFPELTRWLYFLPDELSLPMINGTESLDKFSMKRCFLEASGARKAELVNTLNINLICH